MTMRAKSPSPEDARAILDAALTIYPETARFVLGDIRFNMLDEPETPAEPYNYVSVRDSLLLGGAGGAVIAAGDPSDHVIFLAVCVRTGRYEDDHKSSLHGFFPACAIQSA